MTSTACPGDKSLEPATTRGFKADSALSLQSNPSTELGRASSQEISLLSDFDSLVPLLNLKGHRKSDSVEEKRKFSFKNLKQSFKKQSSFKGDSAKIADNVLVHLDELPRAPLLKKNSSKKLALSAVSIGNCIVDYSNLSNKVEEAAEREKHFKKILELVGDSEDLKAELFVHLITQTSDVKDGNVKQELITWQLFNLLLDEGIKIPEMVSDAVHDYAKSRTDNHKENVTIKQIAWDFLQSGFPEKYPESQPCHQSLNTRVVHLVDDTSVSIYYNMSTQVGEIVAQVAWKVGMEHTKTFNIFKVSEDEEKMLDNKSVLMFALQQSRCKEEDVKLVMKKSAFLHGFETEVDKLDRRTLSLVYKQCLDHYLDQECPVEDHDAANLCVAAILAEETIPPVEDLPELIPKYLPSVEDSKTVEDHVTKVVEAKRKQGKHNPNVAKMDFITTIAGLKLGNCVYFKIRKMEKALVAVVGSEDPLLAINKHGIHFVTEKGKQPVMTKELSRIRRAKPQGESVRIVFNEHRSAQVYGLEVSDAPVICRLIHQHIKALEKERENSRIMTMTESSGSTLSSILHPGSTADSDCQFSIDGERAMQELESITEDKELALSQPKKEPLVNKKAIEISRSWLSSSSSELSVEQLQPGNVLLDRFNLVEKSGRVPDRVWEAIDKTTGKKCLIKFYEDKLVLNQVKVMHELLENSPHVCSLLKWYSGDDSPTVPPFLAIEGADVSLDVWMSNEHYKLDKMATSHQLLEILASLHSSGVVLEKIRPSSIVRFLDDKWKIWDLEDAFSLGETFVNLGDADRTAPEILKMSNTSDILITKESNVWSMGALLLELFTGSGPFGDSPALEKINAFHYSGCIPGLERVKEDRIRVFLQNLMHFDPEKRMTAEGACADTIINPDYGLPPVSDEDSGVQSSGELAEAHGQILGELQALKAWVTSSALKIKMAMEDVPQDGLLSKDCLQTDKRERRVVTMRDGCIDNEEIFLLKTKQRYGLRISISSNCEMSNRIVSVKIRAPDAVEDLTMKLEETKCLRNKHQVVADFDPKKCSSKRLLQPSPGWGVVQMRYLRLEVTIEVKTDLKSSASVVLKGFFYCKMFGDYAEYQLAPYKGIRMVKNAWVRTPKWTRDSVTGVLRLIQFAYAVSTFV